MKQSPTLKENRPRLTSEQYVVLAAIPALTRKVRPEPIVLRPGVSQVAKFTGLSLNKTFRIIQELEGDWIEPRSKGQRKSLKLRRRLPAKRAA